MKLVFLINKGKDASISVIEIMLKTRLIVLLFLLSTALFFRVTLTFAAAPILRIVKPTDNVVTNGYIVEVLFETKNFVLRDYRNNPQPVSGQGHLSLWLDQEKLDNSTAQKWFRDIPYTFADVSSGNHTLVVELVGNDNEPLNPRVTQTVKFTTVSDNSGKAGIGDKTAVGVDSTTKGLADNTIPSSLSVNPLSRMRFPIIVGFVSLFLGVLGSLILRK